MDESPINKGGRPAGGTNKRTRVRLATLDRMFGFLGGDPAYQRWCKQHEDFFYEEYTKMLMKEHLNKEGTNIDANVTFKWIVDSGPNDNGPL